MTKYALSGFSLEWLKENGFNDGDIDQLLEILNRIEAKKEKDGNNIAVPRAAPPKVSALIALLESITDPDGRPICFEDSGLINIPDEAKDYFEEDLELEELDRVTTKLKKVKFARRYSDPRKRGTMHQEDRHRGL